LQINKQTNKYVYLSNFKKRRRVTKSIIIEKKRKWIRDKLWLSVNCLIPFSMFFYKFWMITKSNRRFLKKRIRIH